MMRLVPVPRHVSRAPSEHFHHVGGLVVTTIAALLLGSCSLERSGTGPVQDDGGIEDAGDVDLPDGGSDAAPPPPDAGALDAGMLRVEEVAAGGDFSCARRSDGEVYCWGDNTEGQLGVGTIGGERASAALVELPRPATRIALGAQHACAILDDGDLFCWGANDRGQIREGPNRPWPVRVIGATVDVALGDEHSCLLDAAGDVFCWGSNDLGQLGSAGASVSMPTPVSSLPDARALSLGAAHTCVTTVTDNRVYCWGGNADFQLGDELGSRSSPRAVSGLVGVGWLGLGALHSCATRSGQVLCWGRGNDGRLGNGTTSSATPLVAGTISVAAQVAGGEAFTCARILGGTDSILCWGSNTDRQLGRSGGGSPTPAPVAVPGGRVASDLDLGARHACVVVDGQAYCWGRNDEGQLGTVGGDSETMQLVTGIL